MRKSSSTSQFQINSVGTAFPYYGKMYHGHMRYQINMYVTADQEQLSNSKEDCLIGLFQYPRWSLSGASELTFCVVDQFSEIQH